MIQLPNLGESPATVLAEQIQRYLRDHFDEKKLPMNHLAKYFTSIPIQLLPV